MKSTPSRKTSAARIWRYRSSGWMLLAERPLQRIGLSATQKPIEEIARLLVGHAPYCSRRRARTAPLSTSATSAKWSFASRCPMKSSDRSFAKISGPRSTISSSRKFRAHRTTLIFVNTRRLVERVAHQLTERLGEGKVGAHHGSLSRKTRLEVEEKLKSGALPGRCRDRLAGAGHRYRPCRCGLPYRFAAKSCGSAAAGRPLGPLARRDSQRHSLIL